MKVTFYKYNSSYDGFRVQRDTVDKVEYLTKKEVMGLADLRHPILTKREYYENLSTNIKGEKLKEFQLLGSTHLMLVEPFENPPPKNN
jgi:hypothetical protein